MSQTPDPLPHRLTRHPESGETGIHAISAGCVIVAEQHLALSFRAFGDIDDIVLPEEAAGLRADNLWKTTCFELFLKRTGEPDYLEVNVSPSSNWAVYKFDDYRKNHRVMKSAAVTKTSLETSPKMLALSVSMTIPEIVENAGENFRIGLSAVIEHGNGAKSYWALRHPPGAPDFHHDFSFAGRLEKDEPS